MNILILGSGGREHTIAWKIAQSSKADKIYIAPGNAGTAQLGTNLDISPTDFDSVKRKVLELQISLVVVGPEDPLVKGIKDFFMANPELSNVLLIGPDKKGAALEGSKEFAKQFMIKYGIPTAAYQSFTKESYEDGCRFLETLTPPYVLKADGLAAGKGVLILNDLSEAKTSLKEMLNGQFGAASDKVVIEEFLSGIEVSYFVLTDGIHYCLLPEAKDYKRIGVKDTGLNTGGMGAVSPVPFANKVFTEKVIKRIIEPTLKGLREEKIDYRGFIFFGLIKVNNNPFVIEYNARLGDPETEVIIPRITSDFLDLLTAVGERKINEIPFTITPDSATTVMLVSGGYPGNYEKGKEITGFEQVEHSLVFHAGTKLDNKKVLTSGGRVLSITSLDKTKENALKTSYKNAEKLYFEGKYYRTDIGFDL